MILSGFFNDKVKLKYTKLYFVQALLTGFFDEALPYLNTNYYTNSDNYFTT